MNDEETQKKEGKSSESQGAEAEKSESKTLPIIEQTNAAAERLENATNLQRAENDRTETLLAEQKLGGRTTAGSVQAPQVTEEQAKVNQAVDFFKGTELESAIVKANE